MAEVGRPSGKQDPRVKCGNEGTRSAAEGLPTWPGGDEAQVPSLEGPGGRGGNRQRGQREGLNKDLTLGVEI